MVASQHSLYLVELPVDCIFSVVKGFHGFSVLGVLCGNVFAQSAQTET